MNKHMIVAVWPDSVTGKPIRFARVDGELLILRNECDWPLATNSECPECQAAARVGAEFQAWFDSLAEDSEIRERARDAIDSIDRLDEETDPDRN
jgi:hypothetical protein